MASVNGVNHRRDWLMPVPFNFSRKGINPMTDTENRYCQEGKHTWISACAHCHARQHSLARLVDEGVIPVAQPREDIDEIKYVVDGCFACGGPEDARHTFTAYYRTSDCKSELSWLCKPCASVMVEYDINGMLLTDLSEQDILARNPELREAYAEGKIERTGDMPAGFIRRVQYVK